MQNMSEFERVETGMGEECGVYSGSGTGKRSRREFRKEIGLWISAAVFCLATQAAMLLVFLDWLSKGN